MNLSFIQPQDRIELGQAVGMVLKLGREEMEMHDDVGRWNAPGECHEDVNRMYQKEWEQLTYRLENLGWTFKEIKEEFIKRGISGKWVYYNFSLFIH